jgi:hypothetical protein
VFPTLLLAADPTTPTYLVDRYSNNAGPGATADAFVRLVNIAEGGTPQTSPEGDVCANIYVFDSYQEMISCCSCRLTPNELVAASVANQLTNNPLVAVIPTDGVIKIMPTPAGTAVCNPTAPAVSSDAALLAGFTTHLEISGTATVITEADTPSAPLGSEEAAFLSGACLFVQYLGSAYGKGTCSCTEQSADPGTGTYSISGTISGAGGNVATVNLTGTSTATVTADLSGSYTFTGLQNGPYTVTPSALGFVFTPASRPATVNNGDVTGVNFGSTVTYSISGRIKRSGGKHATVILAGSAIVTVTADDSGNYTFLHVVNGSYKVIPSNPGFKFAPDDRSVTVQGASVAGVNFNSTGQLAIDQATSNDTGSDSPPVCGSSAN